VSDNSESAITEFFEKAGFKIEFEHRFDAGKTFYKNIIFRPGNNPALPLNANVRRTTGKARFKGLLP
jgi:hypothetical protein